jgi:hypothetical protein
MANDPAYSQYLKALLVAAVNPGIYLEASSEEDACARYLAYGTVSFLYGRFDISDLAPTDVVTWKRLAGWGEFDVQVGYRAKKGNRGVPVTGRTTTTMKRAGDKRFMFAAREWASDYSTSYLLQLIQSGNQYWLTDAVRPSTPSGGYYDDWEEVEA